MYDKTILMCLGIRLIKQKRTESLQTNPSTNKTARFRNHDTVHNTST